MSSKKRRDRRRIEAGLDFARKNEASAPRKHHLVPAFYLRRWEQGGALRVVEVDQRRSYMTSATKAARATDFYSLASEDLDSHDVPPLLVETAYSQIEGAGSQALARLLTHGRVDADDRFALSCLMAAQFTRGRGHREEQQHLANETAKITFGDLTANRAEAWLRSAGMESSKESVERLLDDAERMQTGDLWVARQRAAVAVEAFQGALEFAAQCLFDRTWAIARLPIPLLTTDEPVLPLAEEAAARDERAGLGTAPVIVHPLCPDRMLLMFHPGAAMFVGVTDMAEGLLDRAEAVAMSHELLATCHRWAFESPRGRLAEKLRVPPMGDRAVVEVVAASETHRGSSQLLRNYSVNRWRYGHHSPPSPIAGWFPPRMDLKSLVELT